MSNRYKTSQGEYMNKDYIDRKIREAKAKLISKHIDEYGYVFCVKCKRSDVPPYDCSHIISVKECQETERSELAFSLDNIEILCRKCHQKKDGLNLIFNENNT